MHLNFRKSLFILPNLFTLSSVFCGFYASLVAAQATSSHELYRASLLIVFALFFDIIDGRVARLTRTQSAFGIQIDSLADLVSFGVAPAILVHTWTLSVLGDVGLFAAFAFVATGAIRLARFNVLSMRNDGSPTKPGKYIKGLPIPGAAGMLVSLVAADHAVSGHLSGSPRLVLVVVLLLSLFMVSSIPFRSFKDLRLNVRTFVLFTFALGSSLFLALTWHSAFALGWLLLSYMTIGVVEGTLLVGRRFRHHRAASVREQCDDDEAQAGDPDERSRLA
ncbi:MAG: CDP-diacylglycerol--serine O-phosphatidyltransferase [Myxococcales bacterium]|nr:CDP-diacylglycerol--serine O-phosphatidyltransferase [Myxococcales bacterium]MDD9967719.1 CDP-diacylglycerol--serine O-phosphatidyltransferase [Myxococcales bacterium]